MPNSENLLTSSFITCMLPIPILSYSYCGVVYVKLDAILEYFIIKKP